MLSVFVVEYMPRVLVVAIGSEASISASTSVASRF